MGMPVRHRPQFYNFFFLFSLQTTRKMDLLSRLGQEKYPRGRRSTQGWMCPTLTNLDWAAKSRVRRRHACGPCRTRCMEEMHGESVQQQEGLGREDSPAEECLPHLSKKEEAS